LIWEVWRRGCLTACGSGGVGPVGRGGAPLRRVRTAGIGGRRPRDALAATGGVAVGAALGAVISYIRSRLDDPLIESALGLVAPFVIYLAAEQVHGSGVLAVVVAALILGQHSTQASYATRLQDTAVWKAVQLVLESFAFLMIGLQLPTVVSELEGISASVFLTFVVVIGTLLLHGLTLPWLIRWLGVEGDEASSDAIAAAAAQDKAARAAAERLDELLAGQDTTDVHQRAADVLRGWNTRRRNSAWERLGRDEEEIGGSPASAFRRLRLEMLAAERAAFIAERDSGRIDDEVLRSVLHGLDLEEATLNRV
jgi:Sodium/hydrogen exchanger family